MINILFAAVTERWDQYENPLKKQLDFLSLKYKLAENLPPNEVDYIIYAPNSSIKDFSVFTSLKAVLNRNNPRMIAKMVLFIIAKQTVIDLYLRYFCE